MPSQKQILIAGRGIYPEANGAWALDPLKQKDFSRAPGRDPNAGDYLCILSQ